MLQHWDITEGESPPTRRRKHSSAKSSSIAYSSEKAAANSLDSRLMHHPAQSASLDNMARAPSTSSLASSTRAFSDYEQKLAIVNEGKCLCSQYIRARLRRAGFLNRKATQRLKGIIEPTSDIAYEVFPALNSMGEELEKIHPRIYTNVSRQLSRAPFGELRDRDTAPKLLKLVAKDLFRSNITWSKIISIYAVCGGFAIDCVKQGHYDYVKFLIKGLAAVIEDENLVSWLIDNGGWSGLRQYIRPRDGHYSFLTLLTIFVSIASIAYATSNALRILCCHLYTILL